MRQGGGDLRLGDGSDRQRRAPAVVEHSRATGDGVVDGGGHLGVAEGTDTVAVEDPDGEDPGVVAMHAGAVPSGAGDPGDVGAVAMGIGDGGGVQDEVVEGARRDLRLELRFAGIEAGVQDTDNDAGSRRATRA